MTTPKLGIRQHLEDIHAPYLVRNDVERLTPNFFLINKYRPMPTPQEVTLAKRNAIPLAARLNVNPVDDRTSRLLRSLVQHPDLQDHTSQTSRWLVSMGPRRLVYPDGDFGINAGDDVPRRPRVRDETAIVRAGTPEMDGVQLKGDVAGGVPQPGRRVETFRPSGFREVVLVLVTRGVTTEVCSGTLIDVSIVLSAAHCFIGITDYRRIEVVVPGESPEQQRACQAALAGGMYIGCLDLSRRRLRVSAFPERPPGDDPISVYNDISILRLDEPVLDVRTAAVSFKRPEAALTLAGYGSSSAGLTAREAIQSHLQDYRLEVGWAKGENSETPDVLDWLVPTEDNNVSGACSGDSGGPIFDGLQYGRSGEGGRKLVGVISRMNGLNCNQTVSLNVSLASERVSRWLCKALGSQVDACDGLGKLALVAGRPQSARPTLFTVE
nr:trypsin-like serine protease [uncultured Roseateles sp.]